MAVKKVKKKSGWMDVAGILLLAAGLLLFLSLLSYNPWDVSINQHPPNDRPDNFIGPAGAWMAYLTFFLFGIGGYLAPFVLFGTGTILLVKKEGRFWPKYLMMLLLMISISCLLTFQTELWAGSVERLNIGFAGGLLGMWIGQGIFTALLGDVGTVVIFSTLLLASLIIIIEIHPLAIFHSIGLAVKSTWAYIQKILDARRDEKTQLEKEEKKLARKRKQLEKLVQQEKEAEKADAAAADSDDMLPGLNINIPEPPQSEKEKPPSAREKPKAPPKKPKSRETAGKKAADEPDEAFAAASSINDDDYTLPSIELLNPIPTGSGPASKGDITANAKILQDTLAEFGIDAQVTNAEVGPVVTRYEVLPSAGVKLEKIVGLSNNIALAMRAESVRIQAPIPGKGVVGIEVPNSKTSMVVIREILQSDEWKAGKCALPLCLGKDVSGKVLIADMAEMPHLLIAGATGSGKSVCMNSILAGLLMTRTPSELRLMLIDPKIVEFSGYDHMPHLVVPVITDAKKVALGLRWAINEMESRYKLFAKVGVRNIKAFNGRPIVKQTDLFGEEENEDDDKKKKGPAVPDRLPYIVIVVDELADLMMVARADIENSIARLAQLSRAVGIHMILATQRPSVNVITGTIKANFPARIAFQVTQKVDSRTILDTIGADKLLGKGDMLFMPPSSSKLLRSQGSLTTDEEITKIVSHVKSQGEPEYESAIKDKIDKKPGASMPEMDEDDELMETAIEIIRQTKRASTSSLQRRLSIGYTRAARLMDYLEERGVVGPPRGSEPREILIDLDGEIPENTE